MPYFRDLLITDPSRGESIFDMEPELVERVRKKMQGMVSKKSILVIKYFPYIFCFQIFLFREFCYQF